MRKKRKGLDAMAVSTYNMRLLADAGDCCLEFLGSNGMVTRHAHHKPTARLQQQSPSKNGFIICMGNNHDMLMAVACAGSECYGNEGEYAPEHNAGSQGSWAMQTLSAHATAHEQR